MDIYINVCTSNKVCIYSCLQRLWYYMSWIMWYKLKGLNGGVTKADSGASAPVGPSVAMPLVSIELSCTIS